MFVLLATIPTALDVPIVSRDIFVSKINAKVSRLLVNQCCIGLYCIDIYLLIILLLLLVECPKQSGWIFAALGVFVLLLALVVYKLGSMDSKSTFLASFGLSFTYIQSKNGNGF